MNCKDCAAYHLDKQQCHRYPKIYEKGLSDWCMEYKEVTHAEGIREDEGQLQETRVEPEVSSDEGSKDMEQQTPQNSGWQREEVKKRGWPKGKPRK